MRNIIISAIASLVLATAPVALSNAQGTSAAGGMSVGTAVAIGVVGAALLVALGDSSSSAAAGVAAAAAAEETPSASTTTVSDSATTTTTSTTTTGTGS